jgi:hypothetical protein
VDLKQEVRAAFNDPTKRAALVERLRKQAIAGDYEAVVWERADRAVRMVFRRSISPLGVTPDDVARIGKELEDKSQKWALAFAERLNSISGIASRVSNMDRLVLLDVEGRSIVLRRTFTVGTFREVTRENVVMAGAQVKQHYGMHYDLIVND